MKIEIEIPEGKKLIEKDGIYTLVNELPITERVKSLQDAVKILGEDDPTVIDLYAISNSTDSLDIMAYAKLRVIIKALNEGWKPLYDKRFYYLWLSYLNKKTYNELSKDCKNNYIIINRSNCYAIKLFVSWNKRFVDSCDLEALVNSHFVFKSSELAEYCVKQFIDIWIDYLF